MDPAYLGMFFKKAVDAYKDDITMMLGLYCKKSEHYIVILMITSDIADRDAKRRLQSSTCSLFYSFCFMIGASLPCSLAR